MINLFPFAVAISPHVIHTSLQWENKQWEYMLPTTSFEWYCSLVYMINVRLFFYLYIITDN